MSTDANLISGLRNTLGLSAEADSFWTISEKQEENGLYLIHYDSSIIDDLINTEAIDPIMKARVLNLRGVIVYLPITKDGYPEKGLIVTRGFGYTPTCTVEKGIKLDDGKITLMDNRNNAHMLDFNKPGNVSITPAFDGCVLRISKFAGKTLMTTARRLNIEKSRWGSSPTFPEMYKELHGPEPMSLFDTKVRYSNITHLFMLCHPALCAGSRCPIGDGYLVYLGYQVNNLDMAEVSVLVGSEPYETVSALQNGVANLTARNVKPFDSEGKVCPPVHPGSKKDDPNNFGFIVASTWVQSDKETTLEQVEALANKILIAGYSAYEPEDFDDVDPRLTQGESLIVAYSDAGGNRRMIRLAPVASNWRIALMDNTANRYHTYVCYYSYCFPAYAATKYDPTTPGENWVKVFNGNESVYSYEQLFPYCATPTGEEFRNWHLELSDGTFENGCPAFIPDYFTRDDIKDEDSEGPNATKWRDLVMRNIACCLIQAAAPSAFLETILFYGRFISDLDTTINELCTNYTQYKSPLSSNGETLLEAPGLVDNELGKGSGPKLSEVIITVASEHGMSKVPVFSKKEKKPDQTTQLVLNPAGKALMRLFVESAKHAVTLSIKAHLAEKQTAPSRGRGRGVPKMPSVHVTTMIKFCRTNLENLLRKEHGDTLYSVMIAVGKYIASKELEKLPIPGSIPVEAAPASATTSALPIPMPTALPVPMPAIQQ